MRILLIEGDAKLATVIKRGLVAETYLVDVVHDGRDGLDLWETYDYDMLLLDLSLPGIAGTEVLRRIRERSLSVPVLVLSACEGVEERFRHLDGGADAFLAKPFAFSELLARIKTLMRRSPANAAASIRINDLELDRISRQVTRAGCPIVLTSKEYLLLEYLMCNAGRVLSRNMILHHVWDESFDGVQDIVEVYIRQLRSKVDDGYAPKLLQTVRGVGYTICSRLDV
jgi:two-component system copper resistance phosphate regulon response regulator CusR